MKGGEFYERGRSPLYLFTPLSSQKESSLLYNGSGWRGVRGQVKNNQPY